MMMMTAQQMQSNMVKKKSVKKYIFIKTYCVGIYAGHYTYKGEHWHTKILYSCFASFTNLNIIHNKCLKIERLAGERTKKKLYVNVLCALARYFNSRLHALLIISRCVALPAYFLCLQTFSRIPKFRQYCIENGSLHREGSYWLEDRYVQTICAKVLHGTRY